MSIDSANSGDEKLREISGYAVSPEVRVRRESFGLLFYNTRDTKLTFVKSGDLLRIDSLPRGSRTITAVFSPAARLKVRKLLDDLLNKGLIVEA